MIIAAASVRTGARIAEALDGFGATTMVYALSPGPAPDGLVVFQVDEPMGDGPDALPAHWHRHMYHPSAAAIAAFDRFDPDRTAIVVRMLSAEVTNLAGRPLITRRSPSWVALEDKTLIDAFWDRHGIPRKPSAVVDLATAASASSQFDEGHGTVWAAEARHYVHAGASLTRWVRDADDAAQVVADFRPYCDLVRVMPFVEGIPCSIHGVVTPDGVAVLRPVEMIVLRRENRFVYVGANTYWDPDPDTRRAMRDTARRIGIGLADEVGFRGAFTVDGMIDEAGSFWPSELNPRVGGGLMTITEAPGAPPPLLFELLVAGADLGLRADELERRLVELADAHRSAMFQMFDRPAERRLGAARYADGRWSWTDDDGHASVTASDIGVIASIRPGALEIGRSAGAAAASFARFCDDELGTAFGELTPPPASG